MKNWIPSRSVRRRSEFSALFDTRIPREDRDIDTQIVGKQISWAKMLQAGLGERITLDSSLLGLH